MKNQNPDTVRHDRRLWLRSTSMIPMTGVLQGWGRGVSRWFRSLERDLRLAGLVQRMRLSPRSWRRQFILVVSTTRYPAMAHSRPRGHFLI